MVIALLFLLPTTYPLGFNASIFFSAGCRLFKFTIAGVREVTAHHFL